MENQQAVVDYYEATRFDYRFLWAGRRDRSLHFGYFDEVTRSHAASLLRMNEILAETVAVTSSDVVLDAGCGYGGSALWLAERYGCRVKGLTLVPFQARRGQLLARSRHLDSRVEIRVGDFTDIPYPDRSFAVYWALESVVHAPDLSRVLAEACRVLAPGGRLVLSAYTLRERPPLTEAEHEYLAPWLAGWVMPHLYPALTYRRELEAAGFSHVVTEDITPHVIPSLRRLQILWWLLYPVALIIGTFFFRAERMKNYYASRRQVAALKKGLWQHTIISAYKPV